MCLGTTIRSTRNKIVPQLIGTNDVWRAEAGVVWRAEAGVVWRAEAGIVWGNAVS